MRLLLISDTHARPLPEQVWTEVERADVVVHAGDWVSADLLDELEARGATVLACWGNNDGAELRARLPEVARAEIEGVRVAVTHETGGRDGRERRALAAFPDTDVLVFGHSHIPWDSTADGLRLLNPGSPTDRRRQPVATFMVVELADGAVADVQLHPVGAAA